MNLLDPLNLTCLGSYILVINALDVDMLILEILELKSFDFVLEIGD